MCVCTCMLTYVHLCLSVLFLYVCLSCPRTVWFQFSGGGLYVSNQMCKSSYILYMSECVQYFGVILCVYLLVSACVGLLVCVHMCSSVCLSQHHESVELAAAETSKAGLRASSLWLDGSLSCSWETRQQREKRKENKPSSSSSLYSCHLLSLTVLRPPALQASSSSSLRCISLSPFLLSFFHCPVLCCPPSPLPLNSSCSLFSLFSLPWSLHHSEELLAQGDGRRPFVKFKAVWRFQRVPGGSLRKPFQ